MESGRHVVLIKTDKGTANKRFVKQYTSLQFYYHQKRMVIYSESASQIVVIV
mgnify:CR=1 FL=1